MGKFIADPLTTMLKVRLVIPDTSHNYSPLSDWYPIFEMLKPDFSTVAPIVGKEVPTTWVGSPPLSEYPSKVLQTNWMQLGKSEPG